MFISLCRSLSSSDSAQSVLSVGGSHIVREKVTIVQQNWST